MTHNIIINKFENNILNYFEFEIGLKSEKFEDFKVYIKHNEDIIKLFLTIFEGDYNTFIFCEDSPKISELEGFKIDDINYHHDKRFSNSDNKVFKEMMISNFYQIKISSIEELESLDKYLNNKYKIYTTLKEEK